MGKQSSNGTGGEAPCSLRGPRLPILDHPEHRLTMNPFAAILVFVEVQSTIGALGNAFAFCPDNGTLSITRIARLAIRAFETGKFVHNCLSWAGASGLVEILTHTLICCQVNPKLLGKQSSNGTGGEAPAPLRYQ